LVTLGAAVLAGVAALPFLAGPASAAASVAPTDPFYGFPASFVDSNGVRLAPCLNAAMCPSAPPDATKPATVPDNFPDLGVYSSADARMTTSLTDARFITALNFAFVDGGPPASGQQIVFGRVRIRVKGLVPGAQYTITHPYGVLAVPADAAGNINTTSDIGCHLVVPCDFSSALDSPVARNFLTWDTGAPAGFIGDGVNPHTVTGSPNGTNFFRVDGPNAGGLGINTLATNQFVVAGQIATSPFARGTAPQSVAAAAGPGARQITVTWTPPASTGGDVTGYTVFRSFDGSTWSARPTTGPVTSFTDTGLANHQTVMYKVAEVNAAGQGVVSAVVSATTFDIPAAPTSLTGAGGPGAHDITLHWSAPTADGGTPVTGYRVYRKAGTGAFVNASTVPAATLQFTDQGLEEDVDYVYVVTATNLAGEGPRTAELAVTSFGRPTPPQDISAIAGPGAHEVSLSWLAPGSDGGTPVTGYQLERAVGDGAFSPLGDVLPAGSSSFSDTTVAERTTYRYRVAAINLVGPGAYSAEMSVTSFGRPAAPASVDAHSGPGIGDITVTWSGSPDDGGAPVTRYDVFRRDGTGEWQKVGEVGGTTLTFTDTIPGLNLAKPFHYEIVAANIVGDSAPSTAQGCSAPFPWLDTSITNSLICG
jgi:hypothetical protein